jgi:rare lipoprotein A
MHTRTRGISEAFRVTLYALIALSTTAARPIEIAPEERPYPAPVITERGTQLGLASWYGPGFHGRHTAGGEVYDQEGLTAAHRSLPLGTIIEVTNRESHARVRLRVNDRGPYHRHRVLDLSHAAAIALGALDRGVIPVEIRIVNPAWTDWPQVRYSVQVAAFRDRDRAETAALSMKPYDAHVTPSRSAASGASRSVYRVRVGSYADRSTAARLALALRARGHQPYVVEVSPRPTDTHREAIQDTSPTSPPHPAR